MPSGELKVEVKIKPVNLECRTAMRHEPCNICGGEGDTLDTFLHARFSVLEHKYDEWIPFGAVCETCRAKIKEVL